MTRAEDMFEPRTLTVSTPDPQGLRLTCLAKEAPTLDHGVDEVEEIHSRTRTSDRGTARSLPSAPDSCRCANLYAGRRVAMIGSEAKGDKVFIGNLKMVDLWSPPKRCSR